MQPTIQSVLQHSFAAYASHRRLPPHVHRAARSIMRCRTAALGGHVLACSAGHIAGVWYNSCRHRSCPQCSKLQIDRWLDGWRTRLLPCDHYHVIFTLPHDLLELWQLNRKRLTDHLFRAVRETLFELLGDSRYLGAQPGMVAALHTWGRTLTLHPHVHCLVTGGGLAPDGRWRTRSGGTLLPVRVVKALYRGKFMARLQADLERGRLALPSALHPVALSNLVRRLYEKSWNVRIQERYPHGHGVIEYLARYLRGGPIRNRRVMTANASHVAFTYRDHRDGRNKSMSLATEEFLRRLLWHVPEPRTHVVRLYGVYARNASARCESCRRDLARHGPRTARRPARTPAAISPRPCAICGRPIGLSQEVATQPRPRLREWLTRRLKSP